MKKQIKNYLKIGFFLLGIAFTTISCEKEDESQENQLFLLSQKQELKLEFIQKNFSLKNCKDDYFKSNLQIKWKEYSAFINIDSTISYEFSTSLNSKISSVNNKYHFYTQYKLQATIDNSNNVSYRILKYLSNNKQSLKKIDYNSLNDFSGTISHFNLDGKSLKIEAFDKGKFIQEFKNSSNKGNVSAIEAPIGQGTWVPIIVERWTDWYKNSLGGNIIFFYSHSSNLTVTTEWLYIETEGSGYSNTTYHSHTDAPHGPGTYPDPDIDNHVDEILIDPSFENSKANCVYGKLINNAITNHNLITDTFIVFGESSIFGENLIYKTVPNLTNSDGEILGGKFYREGNNYYVVLNGNQLANRSSLEIATTILHETIHALLRSKYVNTNESFAAIFGEYMKSKTGSNILTHNIMRDNYIPAIANALKQFDNNEESNAFYETLAWEGLDDFLTEEERIAIIEAHQIARNKGLNCN